jgi:enterochelin esterase family protein
MNRILLTRHAKENVMRNANMMILAIIALFSFWGEISEGEGLPDIESPRIRALADQLESSDNEALGEFWKEMEENTTPLIEAIGGEANHVLLTVLWRGDKETENVILVGEVGWGDPLDNPLGQLLDSDVWFRTYRTRTDLRATYRFSPNDLLVEVSMDDAKAVAAQRRNYRRDPLNPRSFGGSLVELPEAPKQPWIVENPEAPRGEMRTEKKFKSAILGNERRISVYLPPDYDPSGAPYPMFLVFDQLTYVSMIPTPRILNNLIYAEKIPPVVAVFVGNARGARNDELTYNDTFVDFLASELVPWIRENFNVSTHPRKIVIAGSSFGGLAASFVAFRHPELFGNVIFQSGSYWWSPDTNSSVLAHEVEGEWLTRQYAEADSAPIRFFIEIGLHEGGAPSMVIVNRHFRDVLLAKGYEIVKYDEFNGGHNHLNWRGSLADGLIALIGK